MRTIILTVVAACCCISVLHAQDTTRSERVMIESEGWELIGDLVIPDAGRPVPAVLLLNRAAGDRRVYETLAHHLANRQIASLRLDLRGHGESTNRGNFVPGAEPRSAMIWDAEADVYAAHRFLQGHADIDAGRVGMVGGSYSGEEMAEAGRLHGYAQAYVALSPGSFSNSSIRGIDASGIPWLFVVSRDERHLHEIAAAVQEQSARVYMEILPGTEHATRLLTAHPELAERLAVWLANHLSMRD